MCLGLLANVHDAEDVAQDAMLKGLLRLAQLREGAQFSCWILQIAKNLCMDFHRRPKRLNLIGNEYPEKTQLIKNDHQDLHCAIKQLPKELRVPLVMYYFDNKNAKIIAQRMNISHSGACQKIRMARQQLHERLSERVSHEQ